MEKRDKTQLSNRIVVFLRQNRRKSDSPFDPNDRHDDRRVEELIKRVSSEERYRLMNWAGDDASNDLENERPDVGRGG